MTALNFLGIFSVRMFGVSIFSRGMVAVEAGTMLLLLGTMPGLDACSSTAPLFMVQTSITVGYYDGGF